MAHCEQSGNGVGHEGGVQGADQGEEVTGGVGEAGHRARRILDRTCAPGEHRPRRADRDRHFAGSDPDTQRRRHVVAGPDGDGRARGQTEGIGGRPGEGPGLCPRLEDVGDDTLPVDRIVDGGKEVVAVPVLGRRPVARARCVAPVRHQLPGEPEGQPVVGQKDVGHAPKGVGLGAVEPRELGDREGRHGDAPTSGRPDGRLEAADEPFGVGSRPGVVPQHRRAEELQAPVHDHHAVLLPGHGQPSHLDRPSATAGLVERPGRRLAERAPPLRRVLFAGRRGGGGVGRLTGSHELAGGQIAQLHLGGLRGRVHAHDERHLNEAIA